MSPGARAACAAALFLSLAASSVPCPGPSCYTPSGGVLETAAFSAWLTASAAAGASLLALAPGTYTLPPPAAGVRAHLLLPALADLTLAMDGVTLVCANRYAPGVYAGGWQNITVTGLALRWAEPPSNSAVITAVDAARRQMTVAVEAGMPVQDFVSGTVSSCNVFTPARLRRPLTQDVYLSAVAPAPGGAGFLLNVSNAGQLARVEAGDLLGCRVAGGGMTFQLDGAQGCTVERVTLYGGGVFGFFETGGGGNTWRSIAITYPDPPPGASTRPLLSTSADGMHSVGTRVGPQIDGVLFEGMDDDGIAIHGTFELVTDAAGARVWVADHGALAVGDRVALFDKAFAPLPAALPPAFARAVWTITGVVAAAPGYTPPQNVSKTMPSQKLPAAGYTVLTLAGDAPLPAGLGFDFVLVNVDAVGSGYSIRNAIIRNHRARGLLLKASHGHVENVSITNSSLGGIIVTPELYWEEASYALNVTLVRNVITLTSSGAQSYGGIALGAVAPDGQLAAAPGHAGVAILDNVLVDCGYAPIWLNAAGNVTLRGNRVVHPFPAASAADLPDCCEPLPADKIAVYAQSVRGLVADGNCVQPAAGSALQYLFNATADCDGAFAGGVTLCR